MYKQCTFKMIGADVYHHAWVPAKFAVKGKVLQFKDQDGMWGKGSWQVISAGDWLMPEANIRELERDHLHQRKASDI